MAENDEGVILTSVKAALGLQPDYDPFDFELIMHINSILTILTQLGVGPSDGLIINEETPWSDLLTDSRVELAKSYMYLRVKMLFDSASTPPAVISAYERLITEMEFRLTVITDPKTPQLPPVEPDDDDDYWILDGGEV